MKKSKKNKNYTNTITIQCSNSVSPEEMNKELKKKLQELALGMRW
jgi:hypothetical protein